VDVQAFVKVICGLAALVFGVVFIVEALTEVSAEAEVVSVEPSGATRSPWRAVVRFTTADGRTVTATLPKEPSARRPGDRVAIRYSPRNPSKADYADNRIPMAIGLGVGVMAVVAAVGLFRSWLVERKARRKNPPAAALGPITDPSERPRPGPPGLPDRFL
jgi:hypothetical protein